MEKVIPYRVGDEVSFNGKHDIVSDILLFSGEFEYGLVDQGSWFNHDCLSLVNPATFATVCIVINADNEENGYEY